MPEDRITARAGAPLAMMLLILSGCATVPAPLDGEFATVTPQDAGDQHVGSRVRWGGHVVDTRPGESRTCIEILGRPLDAQARPRAGKASEDARFLACRDDFEDPDVFESGRDITVIGGLTDFVEGRIGEFRTIYPRLDAETLYLWADQAGVIHQHYGPWWYHDPWWPYGPRYYWHRYPRYGFSGHFIIR